MRPQISLDNKEHPKRLTDRCTSSHNSTRVEYDTRAGFVCTQLLAGLKHRATQSRVLLQNAAPDVVPNAIPNPDLPSDHSAPTELFTSLVLEMGRHRCQTGE